MKKMLLLLLLIPVQIFAQDPPVDEQALFSDDNTVIENKIQDNTQKDQMDTRSLGFSGSITGAFSYTEIDESQLNPILEQGIDGDMFKPYMVGDLYIDARMPGGFKGFGSIELKHDASVDEETSNEKQTTSSVKELFVDFNFGRHVYFRTGKQVLQWGRCYLWNPTDMINIENKSFLEDLQNREGSYGVKMSIPFGTVVNIYGFAGMNQVDDIKDVSGAGKFEFLIAETEMAFSVWGKKDYKPVYGYDISTRLLGIDIKGEASYSHGSNTSKVVERSNTLYTEKDPDSNIFQAAINVGRDFDFGEKTDRINVSMEFFYNGDGYEDNPIEDEASYIYSDDQFTINGQTVTIPLGDMKTYLMGHGLYQPNYLSRYYAALFITINEFIISDMTLTLNGISNIHQKSFIASSSLSYSTLNNFTAGLYGNLYTGSDDGEYRAAGLKYSIMVTTGILF